MPARGRRKERRRGSRRGGETLSWAALAGLCAVLAPQGARGEEPKEPQITVRADGTVEARLTIPAPEAEVRTVLADPVRTSRLVRDVISVEVEEKGRCNRIRTRTRGLLRPLSYVSLRCPTPDGVRESLVESRDFSLYESEWRLRPRPQGTEVVYRLRLQLSLPVPRSVVNQNVRRSVRDALIALQLSVTR